MKVMTGPQRDKKWRQAYQNAAPRAEFSRPTDAVFEKAEAALLDPDRDDRDRKGAALAGVPQQVSAELCLSMWIPARDLTVSFSDTEIMTSLGSTPQSPLWTKSLEHLRDFKTIRNAGVSFVCTDREVCTKLGGESVTICGRQFKVQTYSKYSHWYYVDLQRLPDEVSDGLIYDWFARQGSPPVYITPAHVVGGLRSRSRRVYFNQKSPPAAVMLDKRTPLRQICFSGHSFTVVHHRLRAYNNVLPPFIKELRDKRKPARPSKTPAPSTKDDDTGSIPPVYDDQSDTSENPVMADDSASESEPHSGDQSDSESSQRGDMDGIEAAIVARPKSVWPAGKAPKFPVGPIQAEDFAPVRILRAKRLVLSTIAEPAVDLQKLPPSQQEYPSVSSVNSYEWLSAGTDGTIPPDQDIILWDRSTEPARSIGSYVELGAESESILNSSVYQGSVEELSLSALCQVIEEFLANFSAQEEPDGAMATLQAQPSLHRVLLDTKVKGNFQHLRSKAAGHAVLRELASRTFPDGVDEVVENRLAILFPESKVFDFITALGTFFPEPDQYWLKLKLAELDLALQVIAPSIYLDPLKMSAILGKAATALPHPLWLLWDDPTLAAVILSPLMARILTGPLPTDLRDTIEDLRKMAVSAATTVPTHL